MQFLKSKIVLINSFFIFIFLFPLILPIIVVFSGLNIAKTDKSPSNRVAKSILSETRELYFRMPFRNTIQFDNDCFELSRTLVYQPKKNASCLQNNFEYKKLIEFGNFRNRLDSYGESPVYDVIVIGDSQAMGWGVSDQEIFTNVLQANGRKTLNLAVSSYGTVKELFTLRRWIQDNKDLYKKVEFIILQYEPNDIFESMQYLQDKNIVISPKDFDENWKVFFENEYARTNKNHIIFNGTPRLNNYALIIRNFYSRKIRTLLGQNWNYFDGITDGSVTEIKKYPNHGEYLMKIFRINKDILNNKKIIVFVTDTWGLNVDWVKKNLSDEFSTSNEPFLKNTIFTSLEGKDVSSYYYQLDDHMNPKGHSSMGNIILSIINKN